MKIRGFNIGYKFSIEDSTVPNKYYLDVWEQPIHCWIIAQIYHWYDMRVFKLPGFKLLEQIHGWLHKDENYIPISAKQDIRCFFLDHKGKVVLTTFDITAEEYESLKSK